MPGFWCIARRRTNDMYIRACWASAIPDSMVALLACQVQSVVRAYLYFLANRPLMPRRPCRLPVHLHDMIARIRKAEAMLTAKLNRRPSQGEVAEEVGITVQRLHLMNKVARLPTSMNAPLGGDSGDTLEDGVEDASAFRPPACLLTPLLPQQPASILCSSGQAADLGRSPSHA